MPKRCVKCSLHHEEAQCSNNDRAVAAYCVNCHEMGHPANWSKCPKFERAVNRLREKRESEIALRNVRAAAGPSSLVRSGFSYAEALGNQFQRQGAEQQQQQRASQVSAHSLEGSILGSTVCGIPLLQVLAGADELVKSMNGMSLEERRFATLQYFIELKYQFLKKTQINNE